ncbi:MAG: ABC transporter transmembrane domain-containing protein [Candidatus Pacebacteria bacterium]|nr:ABC transporter transmembrane domain-containing protein [Candidatus Paceibacterota bacterium]MDD3969998.1 ABC transporter transmembrane domain-containing protein [Candidatus Paceibacterota bacterium]
MKTYLKSLKLIKEEKGLAIGLIIACFLLSIFTLIEPFFFKEVIDGLINLTEINEILGIFSIWVVIVLVNILFLIGISFLASFIANKIYHKLWIRTFNHLMNLSIDFFQENKAGSVIRNFERGLDNLYMLHMGFFKNILINFLIIIILFPVIFYLNIKMALLFLASVPILIAFTIYGTRKTMDKQKEADNEWSEISGVAYDAITNIFLVKSFVLKNFLSEKIMKRTSKAYDSQVEAIKWWGFIAGFSRSIGLVLNILVFFVGGMLFINGDITIGGIIMFVGFSTILISTFNAIFWNVTEYLWQREKINFLFNLIETKPSIINNKDALKIDILKGNITFKNVSFTYKDGEDAVRNISFNIKEGEVIAFVGHTGSGKSTTANLISRFFDISTGKILIDGIDIKDIDIDSLRKNISIVFQENTFFNASFEENLIVGEKKIDKEIIEEACKKAYIWDKIKNSKKGLKQILGDRGTKLSGGEKQRLSIARAIIKDAPILILDEATSALDAKTEHEIQLALSNAIKGKTTIIIAHRLSTIKKADRIFVFNNGEIVEEGKFDELINKKGHFYELANHQITI